MNVCVEGNTRLWIYRELAESSGVDDSVWSYIQCLVYEDAARNKWMRFVCRHT